MQRRHRARNVADSTEIEEALYRAAPNLPASRMEQLADRARVRGTATLSSQEAPTLRSRLAIVAMLVFGFVLSGSGIGLAVSGLSGGATAAQDQYVAPGAPGAPTLSPTVDRGGGDVAGATDSGGSGDGDAAGEADSGQGPEGGSGDGADENAGGGSGGGSNDAGQVSRQLGASADTGNELPFTGWAAIPVLLLGLAFLSGGLILRRRLT